MKKLLLLLLCVPLMFSCGENEEKNNTEEGESNKEKLHNTETANSRIEVDELGKVYLRNISKNEKFEFTLSILYGDCKVKREKPFRGHESLISKKEYIKKFGENFRWWNYDDKELKEKFTQEELKEMFLYKYKDKYERFFPSDIITYIPAIDTIPWDMDTSKYYFDNSLQNIESQKFIELSPGERKLIGYDCVNGKNYTVLENYWSRCQCNDTSKITYSVMGELKIE
jgi:hypothetical protein